MNVQYFTVNCLPRIPKCVLFIAEMVYDAAVSCTVIIIVNISMEKKNTGHEYETNQ